MRGTNQVSILQLNLFVETHIPECGLTPPFFPCFCLSHSTHDVDPVPTKTLPNPTTRHVLHSVVRFAPVNSPKKTNQLPRLHDDMPARPHTSNHRIIPAHRSERKLQSIAESDSCLRTSHVSQVQSHSLFPSAENPPTGLTHMQVFEFAFRSLSVTESGRQCSMQSGNSV